VPEPPGLPPAAQLAGAVTVQAFCADGGGTGSGVIVGPRHVLTAWHVARMACPTTYEAEIHTPAGETRRARLVGADRDADLALLELDRPVAFSVPTVGPPPAIDDRVCMQANYPYAIRRCGLVGRYHTDAELRAASKKDPRYPPDAGDMSHDVTTEPGNSGAGVYDRQGRLVGIVTYYRRCSSGQLCGGRATSLFTRQRLLSGVL
jgi:S1-C subfamily serine protease